MGDETVRIIQEQSGIEKVKRMKRMKRDVGEVMSEAQNGSE
jgi:hypothetical protein